MNPVLDEDQNPLDLLSEDFLSRFRQGERPPISEYTQRHPQLADEIRDLFPLLLELEQAREELEAVDHSLDPGGGLPLQTLGDYRVLREIGRGGMGVVYEAEQLSLGRHVALKVLSGNLSRNHKHRSRFAREAKAAARLHHTNIVPVFDVGECNGHSYYAMQYIQGRSLDELLEELSRMHSDDSPANQRTESAAELASSLMAGATNPVSGDLKQASGGRPVANREQRSPSGSDAARKSTADARLLATVAAPGSVSSRADSKLSGTGKARNLSTYWQRVADIGVQTAGALEYAHQQGILHRDIKPANLLLDVHGVVWVTDFGLAKLDGQHKLTRSGDILGTLRYMAPETFQGKADRRSEVYSLGLTLYELLAMQPAFDETSRSSLVDQVISGRFQPLEKINPAIPTDLRTIVHKAIEHDPRHRYQTAAELAADLDRFIRDEPIQARRVSVVERAQRWARRNRRLAALLLTIAALLIVINTAGPLFGWHLIELNRSLEETSQQNHQLATQKHNEAKRALRAKHRVELLNAQLNSQLYRTEMLLSGLSREEAGGISQILSRTQRWIPAADEPDLRGWEWYYLNGLCHRDVITLLHADIYTHGCVAFSHNGKRLATASRDGTVKVWDVESGGLVCRLKGHTNLISGVCWSPDDTRIATTGYDQTVRIWDAHRGQQLDLLTKLNGRGASVAWHPDGQKLAVGQGPELIRDTALQPGDRQGFVQIWNVESRRLLRSVPGAWAQFSLTWSPDGRQLAYRGKELSILDTETGKVRVVPNLSPMALAWSPQGDAIAVVSRLDPSLRVIDPQTAEDRFVARGHQLKVSTVAWDPSGNRIATAGEDQTIRLWDATTGEPLAAIRGHLDAVTAVAWSPDGQRLATGGDDAVKIWDSRQLGSFTPVVSPAPANGVTWSPDAKRVVLRQGGRLRLLGGDTWNELAVVGLGGSRRAAWSPDGSQFAVASGDSLLILDGQSAEKRAQFKLPAGDAVHVAWSPDATLIAVGTGNQRVFIFDTKRGRTAARTGRSEALPRGTRLESRRQAAGGCQSPNRAHLGRGVR